MMILLICYVNVLCLLGIALVKGNVIYVKENETITLTCNQTSSIVRNIHGVLQTYVSRNKINPDLPDTDKYLADFNANTSQIKFQIKKFSFEDVGTYTCIQSYERDIAMDTTFKLRIQKNPTDLTIEGENSNHFVFSSEGLHTTLICKINRFILDDKLEWRTGNTTLNISESGAVLYSFVPHRKHHLQLFTCKYTTSLDSFGIDHSVLLYLNLNPALLITSKTNREVIENNSLELVCSFTTPNQIKNISWHHIHRHTVTRLSVTGKELSIKHIQRQQAGIYECEVENMVGLNRNFVDIIVNYRPDILFNTRVTNYSQILSCLPSGIPKNFTFFPWEHKTEYGDHVQFIPDDGNGHIMLPLDKYWYQRRGFYVCSVSNGIPVNGKTVAAAEYLLNETGKPHFVSTNEPIKFRLFESDAIMYLYYISYPPVTDVTIFSHDNGSIEDFYTQDTHDVAVSETVNGRVVRLKGSRMLLSFKMEKSYVNQIYTVTFANSFGSSNITIDLKQNSTSKKESKAFSKDIKIWMIVSAVVVVVLIILCGCMRSDVKTWARQKFTSTRPSSQNQDEGLSEPAHYDEVGSALYITVFDDVTQENEMDTRTNQNVTSQDHVVIPTFDVIINDIAGLNSDQASGVSTDNSTTSYVSHCNPYDKLKHGVHRSKSYHDYETISTRLYSRELYPVKLSSAASSSGQHLKSSTI